MVGQIDTVQFVLGNDQYKLEKIEVGEWAIIIDRILDMVDMRNLVGMQGLQQIFGLVEEHYLKLHLPSDGFMPHGLKRNSLFLDCVTLVKRPIWLNWPLAKNGAAQPVKEQRLLLGRDKCFYMASVIWNHHGTPARPRFEGSFSISLMNISHVLNTWGTTADERSDIAKNILIRIWSALCNTHIEFQKRLIETERVRDKLGRCLNRICYPTTAFGND